VINSRVFFKSGPDIQYLGHFTDDKLPPLIEFVEAADLDVVLVNHPELEIVEVVEGADLVNDVEAACAVVAEYAVEGDWVAVKVVLILLANPPVFAMAVFFCSKKSTKRGANLN
jgi:hypothetical protein